MRLYDLFHWLLVLTIIVLLFFGKKVPELVDRLVDFLGGLLPHGVFKS